MTWACLGPPFKPLDLTDDQHIPEDLRLAYKILKNGDCLPPEIELKKEIQTTHDLLADMPDTAERYRVLQKLNFLIMKLNTTRNGDTRFDMPQHYTTALVERMASGTSKEKR